MSLVDSRAPSADLIQRLRRLGLIDDEGRLYELDDWLPPPVQATLLAPEGTRSAVRMWFDSRNANRPIPLTGLLVILSQMRQHPHEASGLMSAFSSDFANELAKCALAAARDLHTYSRSQFGRVSLDIAVNAALDAQTEFLFAVSCGRLSNSERTEALGKYAVAVALSSRWTKPELSVVRRAYAFQRDSIANGNTAPEAFVYLVELLGELFNQTGEMAYLEEAIGVAKAESLLLAEAELLLKRGLRLQENRGRVRPASPCARGGTVRDYRQTAVACSGLATSVWFPAGPPESST
jgi:hypothetical protein